MNAKTEQQYWVAFTGKTDLKWLRVLKKNFRHCLLIIRQDEKWLTIEPLAGHIQVTIHDVAADCYLPDILKQRGFEVIAAMKKDNAKMRAAPFSWISCVEIVKRLLGIHARSIITPWQLYKYLSKNSQR